MNKDALLATAIGFVIGLAITGLLLVGPTVFGKIPKISFQLPTLPKSQPTSPTPSSSKDETLSVSIDSPIADSIESSKELLVSGKSKPGSIIVIQGTVGETSVTTNDDGVYAGKITLVEGKNDIEVTSSLKDASMSQQITVFYTPESL